MLGRDLHALFKLFEEMVNSPDECERVLLKAREALGAPQEKFIAGLRC